MNTNCRKNDLPGAGGHELNQQAQKFHHATANNGAGHCSGHKTASRKGDTSQTLTKLWRRKRNLLIEVALEKKGWVTRIFTCAYTYFCTRLCILTWQTGLLLFGLTVQNPVAPVQPSILVPLLMWGMNHSSYSSRFIKSSAVPPPRLTDFSFVGKVVHRRIPTAGGNAGTETELWPQQQSPDLYVCLKETESHQHYLQRNVTELPSPGQTNTSATIPSCSISSTFCKRDQICGRKIGTERSSAPACSSGPELTQPGLPGYLLTSASLRPAFFQRLDPTLAKGKRCTASSGPSRDPFCRTKPRSAGGDGHQ